MADAARCEARTALTLDDVISWHRLARRANDDVPTSAEQVTMAQCWLEPGHRGSCATRLEGDLPFGKAIWLFWGEPGERHVDCRWDCRWAVCELYAFHSSPCRMTPALT